jgi:hypothetical protein
VRGAIRSRRGARTGLAGHAPLRHGRAGGVEAGRAAAALLGDAQQQLAGGQAHGLRRRVRLVHRVQERQVRRRTCG